MSVLENPANLTPIKPKLSKHWCKSHGKIQYDHKTISLTDLQHNNGPIHPEILLNCSHGINKTAKYLTNLYNLTYHPYPYIHTQIFVHFLLILWCLSNKKKSFPSLKNVSLDSLTCQFVCRDVILQSAKYSVHSQQNSQTREDGL